MKPMVERFCEVDVMLGNLFRNKKNERLGLLLAVGIFALVAIMQLWRTFAGISLQFGGHSVPIWISAIVGIVALVMSFWMAAIARRIRPIL
jgi:uncharacterized membrane protein